MLPSVSVVVPSHARPLLMTEAVQSVFRQVGTGPIEVIVVFDDAEPFTPAIEIPDGCSLRVMVNSRARGLAGARNTGILAASHEWVAFLDDDDTWYEHKLKTQFAALNPHDGALMCVSGMDVDNGHTIIRRPLAGSEITMSQLVTDRMAAVHSSSILARRSAFVGELGLIDEALPNSFGEDYDILLRAARLAPIVAVPEPLILVAWKGQSLFARNWTVIAEALAYLLRKHPEFRADRAGMARIEGQIAFAKAGLHEKREARRWGRQAVRHRPAEVRGWLALVMTSGWPSAEAVSRFAARFGRGL